MDEILMQSVIEKVGGQEKKISDMQAAINKISDVFGQIESLKGEVQQLNLSVSNLAFPIRDMKDLSKSMADLRNQLGRPITNTVEQYHYFPKIFWLTIVFFAALIIVGVGWFMTGATLSDYKANDTKYRYLKLYNNKSLQELLFVTDSLYRTDPEMRDSVIQKEEEKRKIFELLQEANSMEKEAEELKRKARGQNIAR
jgi:hypothetical protein